MPVHACSAFEWRCRAHWREHACDWTARERDEALVLSALVASRVDVPFLVVDLAQTADGLWATIECNDGQESGYAAVAPLELWSSVLACERERRPPSATSQRPPP